MKIIRTGNTRSLLVWIFSFHYLGPGRPCWKPWVKDKTFFWLRFAVRIAW